MTRDMYARCKNCMAYALRWRERLLRSLDSDLPAGRVVGIHLRLFPGTLPA